MAKTALGQKPPIGAQINTDHPLIRGVSGLWYFDRGHDYRDRTNNTALYSVTGTPSYKGNGVLFDGSSYLKYTFPSAWASSDKPFVMAFSFLYTGTSGALMLGGLSSAGWWGPQYVYADATNQRLVFKVYGWSGSHYDLVTANGTLKPGVTYSVVCTYYNLVMKIFIGGSLRAQGTTNGSSMGAGGSIPYYNIGCNETSSNKFTGTMFYQMYFHEKIFSDEQAKLLSSDPYCFMAPRVSVLDYFVPSAGGGGNTISVPVGSLSLSGFAPTVSVTGNNTISVPAGSLSLTGNAPTVIVSDNKVISVPAGSLTLTGNAPTVIVGAGNIISVPTGSLTLTGNAPTVVVTNHQFVSVPFGTLTLTGNAPTVISGASNVVQVPSGSLALTGYAPTVIRTQHNYIDVPKGTLTLQGRAPIVSNGSGGVATETRLFTLIGGFPRGINDIGGGIA